VVAGAAVGAFLGHDGEDLVRQRRMHGAVGGLPLDRALVDGGVGAFGLAGTAVDALGGDHGGHGWCAEAYLPQGRRSSATPTSRPPLPVMTSESRDLPGRVRRSGWTPAARCGRRRGDMSSDGPTRPPTPEVPPRADAAP